MSAGYSLPNFHHIQRLVDHGDHNDDIVNKLQHSLYRHPYLNIFKNKRTIAEYQACIASFIKSINMLEVNLAKAKLVIAENEIVYDACDTHDNKNQSHTEISDPNLTDDIVSTNEFDHESPSSSECTQDNEISMVIDRCSVSTDKNNKLSVSIGNIQTDKNIPYHGKKDGNENLFPMLTGKVQRRLSSKYGDSHAYSEFIIPVPSHPNLRRKRHPEWSISILKEWLSNNISHPYIGTADMISLMNKTKLTRAQISGWMHRKRSHIFRVTNG
jgi:hypothetical protein